MESLGNNNVENFKNLKKKIKKNSRYTNNSSIDVLNYLNEGQTSKTTTNKNMY
jgi:lipoate synthase